MTRSDLVAELAERFATRVVRVFVFPLADVDLLVVRDFVAAALVDFELEALLATLPRRAGARTTSSCSRTDTVRSACARSRPS